MSAERHTRLPEGGTRTGRRASVAGSPVLVGAVTVLVAIVAVFLAYNATSGLPFVPTYDIEADLPNAANLVTGNEVRVAGTRVGIVDRIEPVSSPAGEPHARIRMRLDKSLEPLPADSTLVVRPRSALGLKYVELTPGSSSRGYRAGATMPLRQARPAPVEIDEVLNAFGAKARRGAQRSLDGYGTGLAGRGADLNLALAELPALLAELEPVMRNLAQPDTGLARFVDALAAAASEVAPAAEAQASLFAHLDTTFSALAEVARPYIQETISESPPTQDVAIAQLPLQRPFLRNAAALMRELRPGTRLLPQTMPDVADALESGAAQLPRLPRLNRRLASLLDRVAVFGEQPAVRLGIERLTEGAGFLDETLHFAAPAQTACNYGTIFFRNVGSLLSEGDANGTWQRFIIIAAPEGPNSEGGPSNGPASGPGRDNYLHTNPYPSTAAPGQARECEAGNEPYVAGRTAIGNVPGNQGTRTSGQPGEDGEEDEE